MSDSPYDLRPLSADEFGTHYPMLARAFLSDVDPVERDNDARLVEPDRTLGTFDGAELVGLAAAFGWTMTVPGGQLPTSCVTMVGVAATHRRQGILSRAMDRQLHDIHDRGEVLAALWASEAAIYGRFGYGPATARSHTTVRTTSTALRRDVHRAAGRLRIVDAGTARPHLEQVYEQVRPLRAGHLSRSNARWDVLQADPESFRDGASSKQYVLHEGADGSVDGYASYRMKGSFGPHGPDGTLLVHDLVGTQPAVVAALWGYLLEVDLVRTVDVRIDDPASPLPLMVDNPLAVEQLLRDALWVRLVDVPGALAARRYSCDVDVVLAVDDPRCPWNTGSWRLAGSASGATCTSTSAAPDVTVDIRALGGSYLGGTPLSGFADAGMAVEHAPGALSRLSTALAGDRLPFCPEIF